MPVDLQSILLQSQSDDWSARERSAVDLASFLPDPVAFDRLTALLSDPDIAVQVEASGSLVRVGGVRGLRSVLDELGRRVDDPDADHIAYKLQELQGLEDVQVLELARKIAVESPSDAVRSGIAEIEKLFGHYA